MENSTLELIDVLASEIGALTLENQTMAEALEQLRAEVAYLKQRVAELEQALELSAEKPLN